MHFFLPLLLCFVFKRLKKQKRHIPKKCPFLRLPQRNKSTLDRNVPCHLHGHTDSKSRSIYVYLFEVVVQEWTFTISLPNFLFSDLCFSLPQMFLTEMPNAFLCYNLSRNQAKCKIKKEKKIVFSSKVLFGEDSAAMGFQICFKSIGFFAIIKGNRVFDTPQAEFCGMWDVSFVMFCKAEFCCYRKVGTKSRIIVQIISVFFARLTPPKFGGVKLDF